MASLFRVEVTDPTHHETIAKAGDPLKDLCREEANSFSAWLAENEPNFEAGLADWERHAISLYLYKKCRRLDEQEATPTGDVSVEGQDGTS